MQYSCIIDEETRSLGSHEKKAPFYPLLQKLRYDTSESQISRINYLLPEYANK